MYRIRKLFRFEAAHQLDGAFSKECVDCIHGHSYTVEIFLTSKCLDGCGMVLDFGILKPWIQAIKESWDHALLLTAGRARAYQGTPSNKIVVLPSNPTAEVMAAVLFGDLKGLLKDFEKTNGLKVERVRVHETLTGWAEYSEEA